MSLLSLCVMTILFLRETVAFLHTQINSSVVVLQQQQQHDDDVDANSLKSGDNGATANTIRLNFNVTLYDVQCDFASVGELSCHALCHDVN